MTSTGNVAADRIERPNKLSQFHAGLDFTNPFLRFLPFAKSTDIVCRRFQRSAKLRSNLLPGSRNARFADAEVFSFKAIEFCGIAAKSFIAPFPNVLDDLCRGLFDASKIQSSPTDQLIENLLTVFASD